MRILFCNYEYPPLGGGGGVINAHLAESLASQHDVTVLTSRAMGLAPREVVNGVEVIRVPVIGRKKTAAASMISMLSFVPSAMRTGRQLVRERSFDVINTHFVVPTGPAGAYLASLAGIPNVLTVHGGDLYDPSKSTSPHRHATLRALIRHLLKRADSVVGQSRNTIDNLHTYYLPDFPCELIPLGIERPLPRQKTRAELGFAADEKIMVTVGRLVARKAVDQLLGMMVRLRQEKLRLVVIGDGPLLGPLQEQANRLGIGEAVSFVGFVSEQDKRDYLEAADLYVSTSQHEGFGLVFLEAMAAGLPVICYDHGGQSDFLTHGVTGGLLSLNDQEAFVEECTKLLAAPARIADIGAENRRRVQDYFIDVCAAQYERLFQRVGSPSGGSLDSVG